MAIFNLNGIFEILHLVIEQSYIYRKHNLLINSSWDTQNYKYNYIKTISSFKFVIDNDTRGLLYYLDYLGISKQLVHNNEH